MEAYQCVIVNAANNYDTLVSLLSSVFQVFNSKCSLRSHYFIWLILFVAYCHYSSAAAELGKVYKWESRQEVL